MTISAMEIVSIFKIEDQATPAFRRIADEAKLLSKQLKDIAVEITTNFSTAFNTIGAGIGKQVTEVEDLKKTWAGLTADIKTTFASTFASVDSGIKTQIAEISNVEKAWLAVASAAGKAGAAGAIGGAAGAAGANPRNIFGRGGGGGGHGGGPTVYSGIPVGPANAHLRGGVGLGVMAALGYGIYEEAEVEDAVVRAMLTGLLPVDKDVMKDPRAQQFRDIIRKNAAIGGYSPNEIGGALVRSERNFQGLDWEKRVNILDTVLPYAMAEARLKDTDISSSTEALTGLPHMFGTYDPEQMKALYSKFAYASLLTPKSISEYTNALSYSAPTLGPGGMGMDADTILFLTAMNQSAGVRATKAGTWIQAFFSKLMPDMSHSKKGDEHNKALQESGLLDKDLKPTWEVMGADGKVDWLKSLNKLAPIINKDISGKPQEQRLGWMESIFGKQGGRESGLMNLPQFIDQFPKLEEKLRSANMGEEALTKYAIGSPLQRSRQALSEFTNLLMQIGEKILPSVNNALAGFRDIIESISKVIPKTPEGAPALSKQAATGAVLGGAAGFFSPIPFGTVLGAGIGAGVGADISSGPAFHGGFLGSLEAAGKLGWMALGGGKAKSDELPKELYDSQFHKINGDIYKSNNFAPFAPLTAPTAPANATFADRFGALTPTPTLPTVPSLPANAAAPAPTQNLPVPPSLPVPPNATWPNTKGPDVPFANMVWPNTTGPADNPPSFNERFWPNTTGPSDQRLEKQSYNVVPSSQHDKKPIITTAVLNIDGQQLAQTIASKLADLYENSTSAATGNGLAYFSTDINPIT